jgi:hypothetical protein
MLRVLNEEDGFNIKQRELMRVRTRNRWLLRIPNPERPSATTDAEVPVVEAAIDPQSEAGLQLDIEGAASHQSRGVEEPGSDLSPQAIAKRKDRLEQLEAQSAERWQTRKRRRRTRGWAGLPADPPGPPRFPSETTIDESRVIINLDIELYRELRTRFARICDEAGVSKKTIAGPERWEGVKDRLVQECPHLQTVMWMNKENMDGKKLALDVICTDVTKRMRTMERKMTIAEAKNALGTNPEESRTIRREFLAILKADHFTSKIEAGQEHWEELKRRWTATSTILQRLLAVEVSDPSTEEKLRAIEVMARDVMKRLRDDQTRKDPQRNRPIPPAAEPTSVSPNASQTLSRRGAVDISDPSTMDDDQLPAHEFPQPQYHHVSTPIVPSTPNSHSGQLNHGPPQLHPPEHLSSPNQATRHGQTLQSNLPTSQVLSHSPSHNHASLLSSTILHEGLSIDPQIDNSLPVLMNGHNASISSQHAQSPFLPQDLPASLSQAQDHSYVQNHFATQTTSQPPIAVYLRLHPSSPIPIAPSIWIATLTGRTFEELRQVAVKDLAGTVCGRVEGILGEGMAIEISRDDELAAYLAVVMGRDGAGSQGAPGFYVQILAAGWKP